jgi:hypothetical protein
VSIVALASQVKLISTWSKLTLSQVKVDEPFVKIASHKIKVVPILALASQVRLINTWSKLTLSQVKVDEPLVKIEKESGIG